MVEPSRWRQAGSRRAGRDERLTSRGALANAPGPAPRQDVGIHTTSASASCSGVTGSRLTSPPCPSPRRTQAAVALTATPQHSHEEPSDMTVSSAVVTTMRLPAEVHRRLQLLAAPTSPAPASPCRNVPFLLGTDLRLGRRAARRRL